MLSTGKVFVALLLMVLVSLGHPVSTLGAEFASPKSYPVGTAPVAVAIGDFNGDGKPDLAVANSGSGNVSILLNKGDGTFQSAMNFTAGPAPEVLALGDFNGDHRLDLVAISPGDPSKGAHGTVSLLLGNGDGTFRPSAQITAGQFPLSVATGDLNGDQKLDLIIGDQSAETLSVLLGNGDGTFQPAKTITLGSGGSVSSIVVADFNADNKPDVVAAVTDPVTPANSGLRILLGNGDGSFQPAAAVADSNHGGYLLVGDFDEDHKPDLVVRSHVGPPPGCQEFCISGDATYLYRGKGDGTFDSGIRVAFQIFSVGGNIAAGDFNSDNKFDLFLTPGLLFLGSGDGRFVTAPFDSSGRGGFVAAADFNSDNLPDLALTDPISNAVVVVLNTSPTSGADLALDQPGAFIDELVGSNVSYRVTIFNEGPQDAAGVTLTETLPAGWKLVSAQPSQGTCSGTTVITCELGTLAEPSSATVDFGVALTAAGTFSDSRQIVATQPDLNLKNNSASMTLTAVLPADLSVSIAASKTTATVGDKVTVSVNVSNSGPGTATSVILTDSFPDNLLVSSLSISQGSCTTAPGNITCAIGTLTTKANVSLSYVVTVQAAGVFAINLHVASDTPEIVATNNDTSVTVTVNSPPDFTLSPASTSLTMKRGGQVTDVFTFPAQGSFSGTIALTCSVSGPSPMPTCGISPGSVTPGNTATLTVNAANLTAALTPLPFERAGSFYATWMPLGLLGCVLATGFHEKRHRKRALYFLMLAATILSAACGGSSSVTKGPPPQNYAVTVTATSGPFRHSAQITLTVN